MTDLEKSKIIAACESVAVPDDEIDTSEIPEITDFSGFKPLSQHAGYFKPAAAARAQTCARTEM